MKNGFESIEFLRNIQESFMTDFLHSNFLRNASVVCPGPSVFVVGCFSYMGVLLRIFDFVSKNSEKTFNERKGNI